ncbi:MAG: carboxypeptidase M32 [Planctomycetota bacterium]
MKSTTPVRRRSASRRPAPSRPAAGHSDYQEVERRYAEIHDLSVAASLAGWDQEVMMPPGGAELRAHTLAALAGIVHERTTDRKLVALVESLHRRRARLAPQQRRGLELVRRRVRKAACLPPELARELALAESRGLESWRRARTKRDFARFAPDLEHMVELKRRVARLTGTRGAEYDALLDDFEPGATTAAIDPLLAELRAFTVPLLRKIVASGVRVDSSPLTRRVAVEAQRELTRHVVTAMGIDLQSARLDLSTHPFCSGLAPGDVRMTSRYQPDDLRGGLFGAIHEAGHGLYEQGLRTERARQPLGGAISMAIHESQSRLWENFVARGRPFWTWFLPQLRRASPRLRGVSVEALWRAANAVRPSLIRVEADELTYNLHIILRYEIERELISGRLEVRELPVRWNDGMAELLGLRPAHVGEGVLQDIHWAMGLFGYFPTYSLGNLYAAQFMEAARRDLRGLDQKLAKGQFLPLREWLREQIHARDQLDTAEQLVRRVTGRPLDVDAFARHLRAKASAIYGV